MPVYNCKECKYTTEDSSNYRRHKVSKRHLTNHMICYICKKQLTNLYHYNRHMHCCERNKKASEVERLAILEKIKSNLIDVETQTGAETETLSNN